MCRRRHRRAWLRSNSGRFRGKSSLRSMAVRPVRNFVFAFHIGDRVRHPKRREDAFVQEVARKLLPETFSMTMAKHAISRVAVLPLAARRELGSGGFLHEREHAGVADLGNLIVGRVAVLLRHEVFVVEEARGVIQDLADGDGFSVRREFGEDFGQTFVVAQLAVVHQQHDGHRSELLGQRGEAEVGVLVDLADACAGR